MLLPIITARWQSRKPRPKLPFCPAMERARRHALANAHSPRRLRAAPREVMKDPLSSVRALPFQDSRTALQCRKSDLGHQFTTQATYTAALILEAYLEPAPVQVAKGGMPLPIDRKATTVHLGLLYRQHAWAKLFSATGEAGRSTEPFH